VTSGFVNQSANFPGDLGEHGIHWALSNADAYNASANYSSVLYRQYISSPNGNEQEPGAAAVRRATLYGAKGCTEAKPNDGEGLLPWYGFSCLSENQGSCGTTRFGFQSFKLLPAASDKSYKCWDFARYGQSGVMRVSGSVVAALLGTGLSVWLAL
jgi:hypothetical protein